MRSCQILNSGRGGMNATTACVTGSFMVFGHSKIRYPFASQTAPSSSRPPPRGSVRSMLGSGLSGSASSSNVTRTAIPSGGWIGASERQQLNANPSRRPGTFKEPKPKRMCPPRLRKRYFEGNKFLDSPDGSDDPNFELVDWLSSSETDDDADNHNRTAVAGNRMVYDEDSTVQFDASNEDANLQLAQSAGNRHRFP